MQTNERKQLLEGALARVTSCDDKRGAPEDSFKVIAAMWSAYLGHEVTPHDVAACMALLKIARIKTAPGDRDSWLDLAGYAACGSACVRALQAEAQAAAQAEAAREAVRAAIERATLISDNVSKTTRPLDRTE